MDKPKFKQIIRHDCFEKNMKKLKKRFRTLDDDLNVFIKNAVLLYHKIKPGESDHLEIFRITGLGFDEPPVYKARKFACKALRGTGSRSGIRIIYAYKKKIDTVELIEMYYKGDKDNEDRERIIRIYDRIAK